LCIAEAGQHAIYIGFNSDSAKRRNHSFAKRIMKAIVLLVLCLIFIQCRDEALVIEEKVQKRLGELRIKLIDEKTIQCNKELMQEVETKADSILSYNAKRIKYDSLTIPYDSIRPQKPDVKFPQYKKPVKPKEEKKDTLRDSIIIKKDSLQKGIN
jgi:hypothetical protein